MMDENRKSPPEKRVSFTSFKTVCMCCTAAMVAETELKSQQARPGALRLSMAIVKEEGIVRLWQGLSPALIRHLIYTGSRVPLYELIRYKVFHLPPASHFASSKANVASEGPQSVQTVTEQDASFIVRAASAGVIAGGLAQFLASPTDLIKIRLQTDRRWQSEARFVPGQPRVNMPTKRLSFISCLRQITSEGGMTGLWRGGLPNVQRAAFVNMGELTTYDAAKRWFAIRFTLEDGPLLHICASVTSSFVAALLGTPADLIKTRIMNQHCGSPATSSSSSSSHPPSTGTPHPHYKGMVDCVHKVVATEGVVSLYRGFFLIWVRMAPWSLTFWLTYEKIRILSGVGGF